MGGVGRGCGGLKDGIWEDSGWGGSVDGEEGDAREMWMMDRAAMSATYLCFIERRKRARRG